MKRIQEGQDMSQKTTYIATGFLVACLFLSPVSSVPARELTEKLHNGQTVSPQIAAGKRRPGILRVGPGEKLKLPSQAAAVAIDGDTIEIRAGTYVDCATWRASYLTIRGVGGRAHIKDKICKGKGIWNINGRNTTIENIEFSGMKNPSLNGAGIRHQGIGLTVRNAYFHDGEEGILGGKRPGNVIVIEDSLFERLGAAGRAHPIYIDGGDSLTLQRSIIRGCVDEGNCFKSRAKHTIVTCNVIASLNSRSSWEIDIPNGGLAEIRDNVIQQGRQSANENIIGFAMESRKPKRRHAKQTLIVENNTVINDKGHGKFIFVRQHDNTTVRVRGNKFVGKGTLAYPAGNERFRTREAAGLKPHPALPAACSK